MAIESITEKHTPMQAFTIIIQKNRNKNKNFSELILRTD
jgi:hypothetical protein